MQIISKVKSQKGSISLFVLLSLLFFLVVVTSVGTSFRNKETSIDANFKEIKAKYEKDIGNEEQIYIEKIKIYTITFDANEGTVSENTRDVENEAMIGILPTPVRRNHIFNGWFTSREGGEEITSDTIITRDITYYAHWTATAVAE